jgi:hypothetical protein
MAMKLKVVNPLGGVYWNLKPGCVYEVKDSDAKQMIETGDAVPMVETAMAPPPGAKRARKNIKSNAISSNPGRDKAAPASDS